MRSTLIAYLFGALSGISIIVGIISIGKCRPLVENHDVDLINTTAHYAIENNVPISFLKYVEGDNQAILFNDIGEIIWEGSFFWQDDRYNWRPWVGRRSGLMLARDNYAPRPIWFAFSLKDGLVNGPFMIIGSRAVELRSVENGVENGVFMSYHLDIERIPIALHFGQSSNNQTLYPYLNLIMTNGAVKLWPHPPEG